MLAHGFDALIIMQITKITKTELVDAGIAIGA